MSTGGYEEGRAGLVAATAVQALDACLSLLADPSGSSTPRPSVDSARRVSHWAASFVDSLLASRPGWGDLLPLAWRLQTEVLLPTLSSRLDLRDLARAERTLLEILKNPPSGET